MALCSHCGREHPPETSRCPISRDPMSRPGPIGNTIDRYKLEYLLGVGGFGSVFRARHVHTDQLVALKTLKKQLSQDTQMVDRFMREAKAAASVGDDHIVRILDAGITPAPDNTAFLAMELLDGLDLKELVEREGPQSPRRLVDLFGQILDALGAAHQKQIVHRDLKPANIFVVKKDGKDFVKLVDFGISKMTETGDKVGLTMTGMSLGTPGYMAPEQFFDSKGVSARADLYSIGAMAYELFAGRLPIEAKSYPEMIIKIRSETPPPLQQIVPSLPAAVCAAVDRSLKQNPDERWATAQEFAAALRSATDLSDAPVSRAVVSQKATPGPSEMFGQTRKPAKPVPPSDAPPSIVIADDLAPAPRPVAAPVPAPAPAPVPAPAPAPVPVPAPLMPQQPQQVQKKRSPMFWVILIAGIVVVLMGSCCAMGAVANMLNKANDGPDLGVADE
jgi:serine/threonine protein kinase